MPQLMRGSREPSCFPLRRGEWMGGCWHHIHKLRQGPGSHAERGWKGGHSSEVGTMGARLTGLMGLPWLWMKRKSSVSVGTLHTLGQVLHGSLPSQSQVPGCKSSPVPRAPGCREPTPSYSWVLLRQGGWVPFPLHAKGTGLQQKGS